MVQGVDARSRGGQNVGVVRPVLGEGVGEVAEQREVNAGIEVAERLDLQVREQLVDRAHAAEQGRHDHHRATILGHSAVELETREHTRRDQPRQQALHRARRQLAGGDEREECNQRDRARRAVSEGGGIRDADGDDEHRQQRDGAEIQARRVGEQRAPRTLAEARPEGDEPLELLAPRAGEVVADVRMSRVTATIPAPSGGIDAIERDLDLTASFGAAELLDDASILIATDEIHPAVCA